MGEAALLISILSLGVSGYVALKTLKINKENHQMKKIEFNRENEKCLKEKFDARPRLEILDVKKSKPHLKKIVSKVDVECLVVPIMEYSREKGKHIFVYDKKVLNESDWVSIEFTFKHIGKSNIEHLYVSWNKAKTTAMFEVENKSYKTYMNNGLLNYRIFLEKSLKPNDTFTLKFNFHKEYICSGFLSAEASIWLFDEYNNVWEQPLFVHRGIIYDSSQKSFKEFRTLTDIEDALKCFENPYLW